jgi:uncharacterized membrane protein
MSKKEWLEAYSKRHANDITIKVDLDGLAWAGFWVGLGLVLAAQVIVTHQVIFK